MATIYSELELYKEANDHFRESLSVDKEKINNAKRNGSCQVPGKGTLAESIRYYEKITTGRTLTTFLQCKDYYVAYVSIQDGNMKQYYLDKLEQNKKDIAENLVR